MKTKQVLVWRTDLRNKDGNKVRTGKMVAQLTHASVEAILHNSVIKQYDSSDELAIPFTDVFKDWSEGLFKKICVCVNSEKELLDIYDNAVVAGLPCSLIKDSGLTEFSEPTYTAVAIGPCKDEDVDKITGNLKLL